MIEIRITSAVALLFALPLVGCGKDSYLCHSRQTEATADLTALNAAEVKFREANGKFAGSLTELQFMAPEGKYYDLKIESAAATTYSATATGKGPANGDVWTVDQGGNPVVSTNAC